MTISRCSPGSWGRHPSEHSVGKMPKAPPPTGTEGLWRGACLMSKSLLFKPSLNPAPRRACPPGTSTRLQQGSPDQIQDAQLDWNSRYMRDHFPVPLCPRQYLGYTCTEEVASVDLKSTSNWESCIFTDAIKGPNAEGPSAETGSQS